ncbi:MAG TPA: exonuclease domain-containing protein, partial [Paenibacillus sp.]|nr:exonuclease domain-containing protein [Paenibacillus sp.]
MQQANIPTDVIDSFFQDGYIDRVETSRSNREWTFVLRKSTLVPRDVYRAFCKAIIDRFAHIAAIRFVLTYEETVTNAEVMSAYWPLFVDWAQREVASVNGWLAKAKVETEGDLVSVTLLDATALELAKKKGIEEMLKTYFARNFAREYRVKFLVGDSRAEEYERFQAKLLEEERLFKQELLSEATYEAEPEPLAEGPDVLQFGYEIKDPAVPIQNIQEEEKKVVIQGTVFQLEAKELRNGSTLFQFSITDFTDSLQCKVFAKTKEDLKTLKLLSVGKWVRLRGKVEYDRFMMTPELVMMVNDLNEVGAPPERKDDATEKRVEFHLHTTMSTMDAVSDIGEYVKLAAKWGHKAIAITDHSAVQAFPEAAKAAKKNGIKMIYGLEANVVNDSVPVVLQPDDRPLAGATYVVYDVETTGLSVTSNKIIEIAGVKMIDGKVVDEFAKFIDPHEKIPYHITQLTNITDEMVAGAPEESEVIPQFVEWVGDAVLVAHNARFDTGFLQAACKRHGLPEMPNPVLDTLELARLLYPQMKNHRLNTLTDKFKVALESHHRAIDDSKALGEVLTHLLKEADARNMKVLSQLNDYVGVDLSNTRPFHCNLYALNAVGKKNLYKLVSLSHTEYFNRVACIPKSKLVELREGILVVSGCEKGEFFEAVLNKSLEEAESIAEFYDVLEIQPITFYEHLVDKGLVGSVAQLQEAIRTVLAIGKKQGKPVIATGNVHYAHPRQKLFRDITIHGITGFSPLKDQKKPDAHFRTTKEMLQEFAFLGAD